PVLLWALATVQVAYAPRTVMGARYGSGRLRSPYCYGRSPRFRSLTLPVLLWTLATVQVAYAPRTVMDARYGSGRLRSPSCIGVELSRGSVPGMQHSAAEDGNRREYASV